MQDRVPLYPGRVKLTPVSGQENVYDMVRADQPTQEGTPLNKATFLTDVTAGFFGLGVDATPNDVFSAIRGPGAVVRSYPIASGQTVTAGQVVDVFSSVSDAGEIVTTGTPSQAIALQSGNGGDVIDVIFSGMAELAGVTQGQEITSPGVQGFGAMDGWLSVFPYWFVSAKIATGSYTGTGTYGSRNPNTLIFSIMPRFIFIDGIVSDKHNSGMFNGELIKAAGISADSSWISILGNDIHCVTNYATYASLRGNYTSGWTLKFYNIHDAVSQLNNSGTTYYWVAIG